jgi:hypothetical protein
MVESGKESAAVSGTAGGIRMEKGAGDIARTIGLRYKYYSTFFVLYASIRLTIDSCLNLSLCLRASARLSRLSRRLSVDFPGRNCLSTRLTRPPPPRQAL